MTINDFPNDNSNWFTGEDQKLDITRLVINETKECEKFTP